MACVAVVVSVIIIQALYIIGTHISLPSSFHHHSRHNYCQILHSHGKKVTTKWQAQQQKQEHFRGFYFQVNLPSRSLNS